MIYITQESQEIRRREQEVTEKEQEREEYIALEYVAALRLKVIDPTMELDEFKKVYKFMKDLRNPPLL